VPLDEAAAAEAPSGGPPLPARSLRILLAEDSLVNQKLALLLLQKQGHDVVVANNGQEAVQAWESREFDLLLMDVQRPVMDGFEASRLIRQREQATGRHVPIVALTAHALKGDRERCLEAGMDDYLSKPVHAADLYRMILKVTQPAAAAEEGQGEPVAS
jgi:CheY-like chemotaxis protein